ncbi:MAG: fibronectin type III domain-containing protein [Candidatus Diapherotrites archaeon]|uniref:Fibronectin type III domain-containing protein n=1 Tax=Candidatus Iainarchaeum sp. TaxID=3101447 RepID=A0A8T4KZQ9_9ARCH|nr:fibronectin type III domain-containing protein [Candidatus Diapherotrites archaeon]
MNASNKVYGPFASTSTTISGLAANSQHCFNARSQDYADNNSAWSVGISCGTTLSGSIVLSSSSHPSEGTWYNDSTVDMLTSGTFDHIHYWVTANATETAAAIYASGTQDTDGTFTTAALAFSGIWYVHAVSHNASHAGTATDHYQVNYDINAPTGFSLGFGAIGATSIVANVSGASDAGAGLHSTPYDFAETVTATSSGYQASSSWNKSGLDVNAMYSFKVRVKDALGNESSFTGEQKKFTLANSPSTPSVSNPTYTTLGVSISANGNPAGTQFAIFEATQGKFVQANGSLGVSAIWQTNSQWGTKTVNGLNEGTQYCFQAKARNGDLAETALSSQACLSTLAQTPAFSSLSAIDNSSISLNWNDVSGENSYKLYISTNGSDFNLVSSGNCSSLSANSTSCTQAGLAFNTMYYFKVASVFGATDYNSAVSSRATLANAPWIREVFCVSTQEHSAAPVPYCTVTFNLNGNASPIMGAVNRVGTDYAPSNYLATTIFDFNILLTAFVWAGGDWIPEPGDGEMVDDDNIADGGVKYCYKISALNIEGIPSPYSETSCNTNCHIMKDENGYVIWIGCSFL